MLVKFALESDAIDNSTTQACNYRLVEVWERFGILVFSNPQAIPNRIRELAPEPQGRWQRTWARVLRYPHRFRRSLSLDENFTFSDISEPDQLAQHHEFEVAVLEETRAFELDISEGEGRLFGDVEGVRLCEIGPISNIPAFKSSQRGNCSYRQVSRSPVARAVPAVCGVLR